MIDRSIKEKKVLLLKKLRCTGLELATYEYSLHQLVITHIGIRGD
jgi:hypothetical protein